MLPQAGFFIEQGVAIQLDLAVGEVDVCSVVLARAVVREEGRDHIGEVGPTEREKQEKSRAWRVSKLRHPAGEG